MEEQRIVWERSYRCLRALCTGWYKWKTKAFHLPASSPKMNLLPRGPGHKQRQSFLLLGWQKLGLPICRNSNAKCPDKQSLSHYRVLVPVAAVWFYKAALSSCFSEIHLELFTQCKSLFSSRHYFLSSTSPKCCFVDLGSKRRVGEKSNTICLYFLKLLKCQTS